MVATTLRYLVRYGAIPEIARFRWAANEMLPRGMAVVVRTQRGLEIGTVLQRSPDDSPPEESGESAPAIVRVASAEDRAELGRLLTQCDAEFADWQQRIAKWKLELEIIDLERTLDGKSILYVLNERGPDCTKLALQAAAEGLGLVEVQPVDADGLMQLDSGGGCGSGGCGCRH